MQFFFRLTILILFFISKPSFSQKIKVFDSETRLPIANVMVFDEEESSIIGTDDNGVVNVSIFNRNSSLWFKHPAYELYFLSRKTSTPKTVYLSPKVFTIDEFVVSASRMQESKKNIPYFLETIQPRSIEFKNAPTGADILTSSGFVAVQKSQGGGGSPILRGFEANRVLLVMDGVRMNNAIYRSGHLQNSITIDPNILEKTEVLFGPSSVIYGSDALGGVVSYFSKDPVLSNDTMVVMSYEASIQTMSATNSKKANININGGFKHWGSLTSFTYSDFGNITIGKNKLNNLDNDSHEWGKVFHYAQRINGKDSMMVNSDPYTQPNTGYQQYDFLQKFKFSWSHKHALIFNFQYSTSSNINRFDQLNDYNGDGLKFAQYYYGPQERLFASINSRLKEDTKFFTSLNTIVAYQNIKESRFKRKFNKSDKTSQEEYLDVYSLNLDFVKEFNNRNKISYGVEVLVNDMGSHAQSTNIETEEISDATSRYPNGGSLFQAYSLYISYNKKFNDKLSANAGARFGYFRYDSKFDSTKLFNPTIIDFEMNNKAPSASIGIVYLPGNSWKFSGVGATGYRVPNVDDYGKIRAKNDEISMPNPFLKPEYAFNIEFSAAKSLYNENLIFNLALYNTWLKDAIVREYQGNDSIEYDGDMHRIYINSNQHKAIVKGFSAGAHAQPLHNLTINATINYTHGKVSSTGEPLGHISPIFGKISANYKTENFKTEFYVNYQGEKSFEDMSPYGEDNEEEGTPDGFPAWQTYNIAAQYQLFDSVILQASIENIFDIRYKTFASGISAPGRNLILSLTGRF